MFAFEINGRIKNNDCNMLEENLDFKNNFYLINKCSPKKNLLLQK